ncbi:hypothetical protein L873DRAFT_138637 [Choiromyces venosus 120613-1]|uniref:Uncharacterized protein n=1 Tax=Choiromyces venosus 120613-1 TaxID=1336337 RepID=A0A3N4J742_9PEZI|nr:hypothetical protein L873DRAFT_138637 [Choiromyces venosus 120613-1]
MIAHRASFTQSNIQSGFLNTGLIPIKRNIILSKIQALLPKSLTISSITTYCSQMTAYPTSEPLPTSLPSFSVQKIDSLYVLQNRVEIERQELIMLATMPRNDSIE